MNKRLLLMAVLSLSATSVLAQTSNLDSDVDSEIDQYSATRTAQGPQVGRGAPNGGTIAPEGAVSGQPIYILNQATPTSNAQVQASSVQKQPQVDILAAPLQKSRAEQIRDARQQVEVETENRIVEKLEQSRIEDEKRRASVLFGGSFNQLTQENNINAQNVNLNQPTQIQTVQGAAVVAAPVVVKEERDLIRDEVKAALVAEAVLPILPLDRRYFGAVIGIGDYPDVRNVRGNYAIGASFGTIFDDSYAVEGTFLYSDYSVEQGGCGTCGPGGVYIPQLVDVSQYSGSLAIKYQFLAGIVRPVFGGLVQYSYRTFGWSQDVYGGGYGSQNSGAGDASSHAIDLGVVTGADIEFSRKFSLGFDFRYMFNMASRVSTNQSSSFLTSSQYGFGTPIEKLSYYTMSLVGKVTF